MGTHANCFDYASALRAWTFLVVFARIVVVDSFFSAPLESFHEI
jgi:hypothetical protein